MKYTCSGRAGGKTAATARMLRENRRAGAIVKSLHILDGLVAMGVKPSQIVLASEMRRDDGSSAKVVFDE